MTTTLNVFGTKPQNAILVADDIPNLRCNCQEGQWKLGDEALGNKLECSILKFSKWFGTLGQTKDTLWGQIFMIAENSGTSPEIFRECLMVTYQKTRSLSSFLNLVTKLQCQGVEAAEGVFIASFKKHSGQKPDDTGVVKPINYYSIEWSWRERAKEDNSIEQLCATLDDSGKFVDPQSTGKMQCLDGLSAPEIQQIISGERQEKLLVGADF
ncbi:hypothetical protein [Okeania sp. SIO1I7]|uniref:hypothetical protein n=1 Tax=Okeania sp. SIO1I7 TaxID=2607772 RepID=UPI0013FC4802|nr:hypothetical protein [Okeania sp. SIO1I7]NET30211.1 hypothetical protein [Okeania sp. SIO1I7]